MVAAIFYNRTSRKRLKERMYTISWTSVEGHVNATILAFSLFAPQSNKLCLLYSCCLEGFWPLCACCVHVPHMAPVPRRPNRDVAGRKKAQCWQKGRCFHHLSRPSSVSSLSPCTVGALNETEAAICCLSKGRQEPQRGPEGSKGIFLQR